MKYYPEVEDLYFDFPLKEFEDEENAIGFYKRRYGRSLMAVILDNDPEIKCVWKRKETK